MNQVIKELLDSAADDHAHPLGFTPSEVTARARKAARRRRAIGSVVAAAAVIGLAGALVWADVVGSDPSTVGPADSNRVDPNPPPAVPTTAANPEQQAVIDRCISAQQASGSGSLEPPVAPRGTSEAQVNSSAPQSFERTEGAPAWSLADGWVLDAVAQDAQGTTATFVSPDLSQFAVCDLYDAGIADPDEVSSPQPLDNGPVPGNWYGNQGFRHHPTADWLQVCAGGEGKVCSRELFHGGFSLHAEVAKVLIQAPDGDEVSATLGAHSYVFRHVEERVDPNRAANDMQALPSVPVTLADASGSPIITYDYFPSYVVPEECLDNAGGC